MDQENIVVTDAVRRAVNREDCQIGGHAFDVVVDIIGIPVSVICGRCGEHWQIAARERP